MFPVGVEAGGTSGNSDQYTVDQTWYNGDSYSPPIFDGGQQCGGSTTTLGPGYALIEDYIWSPSYVIFNGLQLQNIGDPSDCSGTAIQLVNNNNSIVIENCVLSPYGLQAFSLACQAGSCAHLWLHNNTITNAARAVIYGWAGSVLTDVQVYSNSWQGPTSAMATAVAAAGYHLDGLMVGNPISCESPSDATITNISFYNNYFWGSWPEATGQYYSNGCTNGTTIYNNVFTFENIASACIANEPTSSGMCFSPGFVVFGSGDSNIAVYNNTFSADMSPGEGEGVNIGAIVFGNSAGSITVEGNLFSGAGTDIVINPAGPSPIVIDYNLHNPSTSQDPNDSGWINYANVGNPCTSVSSCESYGTSQGMGAWETHGVGSSTYSSSYPEFVAVPNGTAGSGNFQLQSGSPARGVGANLTSLGITALDSDIGGNPRPSSGAWDIGAYEYLPPPTGLKLVQ